MSTYRVSGKKVISECSTCGIELENLLKEAGTLDTCPECEKSFTVPGAEELAAQTVAEELRKRAERQAKAARETARAQSAREIAEIHGRAQRYEQDRRERQSVAEVYVVADLHSKLPVPEYKHLAWWAKSYQTWGEVLAVLAVVVAVLTVVFAIYVATQQAPAAAFAIIVPGLVVAAGMLFASFIARAIANMMQAGRDIARNSFYAVNLLLDLNKKAVVQEDEGGEEINIRPPIPLEEG